MVVNLIAKFDNADIQMQVNDSSDEVKSNAERIKSRKEKGQEQIYGLRNLNDVRTKQWTQLSAHCLIEVDQAFIRGEK